MRPAPIHVNQFGARGRFPSGLSSAPYDCTVASGVMQLDAATGGRMRPTTTALRAAQDDQDTTGIGLDDLATAHRRLPGAPPFSHGRKGWATVRRRLEAGDGAILQGFYIALGTSRASSFRGPHAIYVQWIRGTVARINDPLRTGPTDIPVSALQRFYMSGIGLAGWSTGAVSTPAPAPGVSPELLYAWGTLVSFPVGHVVTAADVTMIMTKLRAAGFFGTDPVAAFKAEMAVQRVLTTAIGKPWDKALQDDLAAKFFDEAESEADPFGVVSAAKQLVAGISEIGRNALLLVAILGLVIMGLWLVATATDNPLPSPPRIPIGA